MHPIACCGPPRPSDDAASAGQNKLDETQHVPTPYAESASIKFWIAAPADATNMSLSATRRLSSM
jgi:hypothetical protein